jgi:hypothetical protein
MSEAETLVQASAATHKVRHMSTGMVTKAIQAWESTCDTTREHCAVRKNPSARRELCSDSNNEESPRQRRRRKKNNKQWKQEKGCNSSWTKATLLQALETGDWPRRLYLTGSCSPQRRRPLQEGQSLPLGGEDAGGDPDAMRCDAWPCFRVKGLAVVAPLLACHAHAHATLSPACVALGWVGAASVGLVWFCGPV